MKNAKWSFPVKKSSKTKKSVPTVNAHIKDMTRRARELADLIEANKALYKELDDLTDKLIAVGFVSGEGLAIVDNFAQKNTVWKASAIRRFELKRSV